MDKNPFFMADPDLQHWGKPENKFQNKNKGIKVSPFS